MIVRHGEKPTDGLAGFDGRKVDDKSLTVRGWGRAYALPLLFAGGRVPVPDAIIASQGNRHLQTVTPLATVLRLPVVTRWDLEVEKDRKSCAADLLRRTGTTLVVMEHSKIDDLVTGLGAVSPGQWPEDRFDLAWVLTRTTGGAWSLTQVPQRLLPGDRATLI